MLDLQSFKGFTPGKWSAFAPDSDKGRFTVERLGSNQFVPSRKIAIVNPDKGNGTANAALIAAAPDLLALAIKQEAEIKRLREALEEIRTSHIGDIPASSQHDEHSWAYKRFGDLRRIANQALEPSHA